MDYRHEYKFIISIKQREILKHRLEGLMAVDKNAPEGGYEIRSIYFDDPYDSCLRAVAAGVDHRTKYRIRAYNTSKDEIRLEKKSKVNGMTKKEQASLSMEEYESFLSGDFAAPPVLDTEGEAKVLSLFKTLAHLNSFTPKVMVCYYRTPFVERAGNVRVTFDDGIASARDYDAFFDPELLRRPVMPLGYTLMEVKYDEFLPRYIHDALEIGQLQQTSFSKYDMCRRYGL